MLKVLFAPENTHDGFRDAGTRTIGGRCEFYLFPSFDQVSYLEIPISHFLGFALPAEFSSMDEAHLFISPSRAPSESESQTSPSSLASSHDCDPGYFSRVTCSRRLVLRFTGHGIEVVNVQLSGRIEADVIVFSRELE